jgi:predicted metal-dependent RNase
MSAFIVSHFKKVADPELAILFLQLGLQADGQLGRRNVAGKAHKVTCVAVEGSDVLAVHSEHYLIVVVGYTPVYFLGIAERAFERF